MDKQELEMLRARIDRADYALLAQFERRMHAAEEIGAYKQAHGLPVLDAGRERAVLADRLAHVRDKALRPYAAELVGELMALSRARQAQPAAPAVVAQNGAVAFQGVEGAYAHEAAAGYFGDVPVLPQETFRSVCEAVMHGEAQFGVLPVENSQTGGIAEVYELLAEFPLHVVGETRLYVRHQLLTCPGATLDGIQSVYSHEQGFLQCRSLLEQYGWARIPYYNTARAAQHVAELGEPQNAAIASAYAGERYGLKVLLADVSQSSTNQTRFFVVCARPNETGGRATLLLRLPHAHGSLAEALAVLARAGYNLTRIESRPLPGRSWEYHFFLDVEDVQSTLKLEQTLHALKKCAQVRLLGRYV